MKRLLLIIGVFLAGLSCKKEEPTMPVIEPPEPACPQDVCWDAGIQACPDLTYDELFTRSTGWTGGDATYSVALDGNRRVWAFGDSFINQVNPDRTRPSFNLINNCLVLQDGDQLTTFHGGTASQPRAFAIPPEAGHWYWPGDGTFAGGYLYLFMHGFSNTSGGAWDFFRTSIDLLQIDPSTMQVLNTRRISDHPQQSWGAALWEDEDYTYIYGVVSAGINKSLYVARSNADLSDPWEYFSDGQWEPEPDRASPVFNGISEQFSVFRDGNVYYLLTQNNLFGKEIYLYTSSFPQGPFGDARIVYCTPETGGNIFTYNAFAHTGVYSDSLLISYNVNSFDWQDLLRDADKYRPYFVKIDHWKIE